MKEYAPAKINLFLDVIRKREDGYHDLGTLFQTIDAGDAVSAEIREDGRITLCYNEPQDYPLESDLVFKAAKLLQQESGTTLGADIYLNKVMPLGAGLGGGSADAAATLRLLNQLWKLKFKFDRLEEIGARLGADVPFLVRGGTAFAEGIGEKLTFVKPLQLTGEQYLLVATPLDSVPTKDAYAGVPKSGPDRWETYRAKCMRAGGKTASIDFALANSFNAFEESVFPKHPLVEEMKNEFKRLGAKSVLMSGSGASVFGVFDSRKQAKEAAEELKPISRYLVVTRFFEGF
ncbi:4-(cytidine 5'-diphospho)-2-C-methyl-D-erythritol kinase [Fibrobacter sp.]|uniref:4-(cytidine 5'-diphospho)-2-C-methyl-D-erythritol kinase n=1 Tax=Fibrobacter sp. TaxID=35828 RepID=UPI0025C65DE3|nr:4-(cytidine 5'-diphospho)-2-C-methyl-D-erythritol kinase [Fibrobacter sp.]MBS7273060.1 4-(cytidine 5'-diphospho)-2-C-methyl-D-erythritol kinase [Fibrobacter sp.]MDD7498864.1 4-(cytidine 5'-diphospho)-2-C-methyl-D-erythritol kinase [Fibrobacter sp.]MDY5725189.1 4-(cytidine 5'-diphospho)-2-C-methyl-D-erythritol kinase [Fibrobacter sp.]